MADFVFEDLKRYIGFDERDASNVVALRPVVEPFFPAIIKRFCSEIRNDQGALAVLTGGEGQIERLMGTLRTWLDELFCGTYDEAYAERRARIGMMHVLAGLPQHYMLTGLEVIWQELGGVVRKENVPEAAARLPSLHKLLMLELAVMLDAYKDWYAAKVREEEHSIVEERLTRAEHLAEIGQLAASLAHEIKNPLAGISGAIQIMRDGMGDDDARRPIISEIIGQIKRLDETVKDLLLYARPTPPKLSTFTLDQAIERVLKILREEPALQHVQVEMGEVSNGATVQADMRQIEQLILNLLINAAHASDYGGRIHLAIAGNVGFVRLIVSDNGRGMPPETQRRAFEPFFTTKAKGTGLGLSICRRIAEVHGGSIRLESAIGQGTIVIVELPRRETEGTRR
ncbi:MAG: ATP-binding protein [Planctomycetota bacterium]|jgi:signal transduction histidine kinase